MLKKRKHTITISIDVAIPEEFQAIIADYLDRHPTKSLDDVVSSALALFFLQNREHCDRSTAARIYLDNLFKGNY